MIDIQLIRDNPDLVREKAAQKGVEIDIAKLLELDRERLELLQTVEALRAKRNENAEKIKNAGKPDQSLIDEGKKIKVELNEREKYLAETEEQWSELLEDVPNMFSDDTPIGGEDKNETVEKWGESKNAKVQDHLAWLESRDGVDFDRAAKVAGNKFHYSKGVLAELELALANFALDQLKQRGFTLMIVPNLVNNEAIKGTGFAPKGEEKQIYEIESEGLSLIATSEIPLTAYHGGEILSSKDLPIFYVGWSPCYRLEAGAYGKHSKGLFRTHQFYKVEMYSFCKPQQSEKIHEKLLGIQKEICQSLEIPHRVVKIASKDLGAPAYKKYDIEYWSPVDGEYRELTSCSNVTDYQARRLKIRHKDESGDVKYVHTLNGTAMVSSRFPIALIENHQDEEGNVRLPKALQSYMGRDRL